MRRYLILPSLLIVATSALAGIEEEKKIFRLCYAQLAKKRVENINPRYVRVKNGQLKGSDACMELVSSVQLDANNRIPMAPDGSVDLERQRIFQSIFDIHYDIFYGVTNLQKAFSFYDMNGTFKLTDVSEMAYHYTYPLVKTGVNYKTALTNSYALDGIRFSETSTYFPFDHSFGVDSSMGDANFLGANWFNGPVDIGRRVSGGINWTTFNNSIDRGLLIGIKPSTYAEFEYKYGSQPVQISNLRGHFGGGAIGSNAYISSTNHDYVDKKQGGVFQNMPRNFAVSIMREVLCRDLPVLRFSDVTEDINPVSSVSFRQNGACMQCHSTIDPMVYTLKNKYNQRLDMRQLRPNGTVSKWTAGTMALVWPLKYETDRPEDFDGIFFRRDNGDRNVSSKPIGHLKMRSAVTGNLIDETVEDISGLGAAIAETDDFYACSVKRYVKHFTGHDTKLFDSEDSSYDVYKTEFEDNLRKFIFELAADLKANQDPRRVWKRIFNNNIFVYPEQGDFSEVAP